METEGGERGRKEGGGGKKEGPYQFHRTHLPRAVYAYWYRRAYVVALPSASAGA